MCSRSPSGRSSHPVGPLCNLCLSSKVNHGRSSLSFRYGLRPRHSNNFLCTLLATSFWTYSNCVRAHSDVCSSQFLNLAGGLHQGAVGLQVIPIILPPLHRFSVWHCDFVTHKEVDFDVEPWLMKEGKNTGSIEFS